MKLHEIIEKIENMEFVSYQEIAKYKKSLYRYFDGQAYSRYNDLILVVYPIANAYQLATITTGSEFEEVLEKYIEDNNYCEEEANYFRELVSFSSMSMGKLVGNI